MSTQGETCSNLVPIGCNLFCLPSDKLIFVCLRCILHLDNLRCWLQLEPLFEFPQKYIYYNSTRCEILLTFGVIYILHMLQKYIYFFINRKTLFLPKCGCSIPKNKFNLFSCLLIMNDVGRFIWMKYYIMDHKTLIIWVSRSLIKPIIYLPIVTTHYFEAEIYHGV